MRIRKYTVLIPVLIVFFILTGCSGSNNQGAASLRYIQAGSFSLSDYQWELTNCTYSKSLSAIGDAGAAAVAATELWQAEYGTMNGEEYDPTLGRPVKVFYDGQQDCYLVTGTLPDWVLGSVPCALITGEGTVLALWWD